MNDYSCYSQSGFDFDGLATTIPDAAQAAAVLPEPMFSSIPREATGLSDMMKLDNEDVVVGCPCWKTAEENVRKNRDR